MDELLNTWYEANTKNNIQQLTEAWNEARKFTIGGSEMYKLMDLQYKDGPIELFRKKVYGNVNDIELGKLIAKSNSKIDPLSDEQYAQLKPNCVQESLRAIHSITALELCERTWNNMGKVKMQSAYTNGLAMRWGSMFEDVIDEYVQRDKQCKIIGQNMFYHTGGPFSYSPDGLTVLKQGETEHICLVEYKCPFTRKPTSTSMPIEYTTQIQTGMNLLEIPTKTLYTEAVFRCCSLGDLGFNPECRIDLRSTMVKPKNNPLTCGIIGFYSTKYKYDEVISLGCVSDLSVNMFTALFTMNYFRDIYPLYGKLYYDGDTLDFSNELDNLDNHCKKHNYANIGYLPWKLFEVYYKVIDKIPGFLDKFYEDGEKLINYVMRAKKENPSLVEESMINDFYFEVMEDNMSD